MEERAVSDTGIGPSTRIRSLLPAVQEFLSQKWLSQNDARNSAETAVLLCWLNAGYHGAWQIIAHSVMIHVIWFHRFLTSTLLCKMSLPVWLKYWIWFSLPFPLLALFHLLSSAWLLCRQRYFADFSSLFTHWMVAFAVASTLCCFMGQSCAGARAGLSGSCGSFSTQDMLSLCDSLTFIHFGF